MPFHFVVFIICLQILSEYEVAHVATINHTLLVIRCWSFRCFYCKLASAECLQWMHSAETRTFFFFFLRVFMYCVFTRMPGESYRRRFRSLMCSCDVFRALINSLCLFLDGFWLMLVSRGWVINLDTCFVITCWTCLIFVIDTVQELTMFSGMKDSVFLNCESDLWFDELSFVQVKIAWLSGK